MFGIDFYPTEKETIKLMLSSINIVNQVILEPSAGSGNIVKYLKENGAKEVIACEIDSRLRSIVEKECRIVRHDFLDLQSSDISHINLIVMNPPFSEQEKHILHAWEIAPAGCQIISLCNSSMLSNYYTEERKRINELIQYNGNAESFGNVFRNSERATNVPVSCIYIHKPMSEDDDFDSYFDLSEEYEKSDKAGIVSYDFVRDIVNRYVSAVKEYDNVLECAVKMNGLVGNYMSGKLTFTCTIKEAPVQKLTFKKELQKSMWMYIFNQMKMNKYVTSGVRDDINKFVEQQTHVPFTMKNIYLMIEMIIGTHSSRMDKTLIEAFEHICSFSAENSSAGEKWKTNSDYVVNRKFIIPYITESNFYGSKNDHVKLTYRGMNRMDDVLKGLCFLTGKNYDDIKTLWTFVGNNHLEWGQWYIWEPFFKVRGYKKGTMHFEFLDENIWMQFNRRVAEIKGWRLPKRTGKTTNRKTEGVEIY